MKRSRRGSLCRFLGTILLPSSLLQPQCYLPVHSLLAFPPVGRPQQERQRHPRRCFRLPAATTTPLPTGLSPFEKSVTLPATFRKLAAQAIDQAVRNGERLLEVDFPPLIGSKSQFDDYDNVSELDENRDWCVQLLPLLTNNNRAASKCTWLVLPDDKECELAALNWTGGAYRNDKRKFTSIRAAYAAVAAAATKTTTTTTTKTTKTSSSSTFSFKKAWGSTMAETVDRLRGGDGILADSSKLDDLSSTVDVDGRFQLVCQPGNGGPVEDWINVEQLANAADDTTVTCIVNGALDKVRDGYYPALFFPALAKTVPFYKQFTPVLFAKPINDKGYSGWLFRVYPEPWQVVLQTARPETTTNNKNNNDGGRQRMKVENTVVLQTNDRPTYPQVLQALVTGGRKIAPPNAL